MSETAGRNERVRDFFDCPEPEGDLAEIIDQAQLEAAQRMDPTIGTRPRRRVMNHQQTVKTAMEILRSYADPPTNEGFAMQMGVDVETVAEALADEFTATDWLT